jgi:hypothetical protein
MEGKALAPRGTNAGPSSGQPVVLKKTNGLSLLIEASDESPESQKEIAHSLGLPDATYWSKVKVGEKPAPRIDRLTDLPEATQRAYVTRWGRQLGMCVSDADAKTQALGDLAEAAVRALRAIS